MNEKFIKKYMRVAKLIGEDSNPCYSRHIGVVIVHPKENRILGTGYNGPPKGTPHCTEEEYLDQVVWPQLTETEKRVAAPDTTGGDKERQKWFVKTYTGCDSCPRRLIGAKSGQRLEICSCEHAEKNAIFNAQGGIFGSHMFCYCGVPCWDCSKAIINSGIEKLYCIDWGEDYSPLSRWLLRKSNVKIEMRHAESFERC